MPSRNQYVQRTTPQQTTEAGCRENALALARRVLSVFPPAPGSKTPTLKVWPAAATTDEAQIDSWFDERPDINYGILANEEVCFLDVDPRNGGLEIFSRLEAEEPEFASIFRTLMVESGRRDGVSDKCLCPWPEHDDHKPWGMTHGSLSARSHRRPSPGEPGVGACWCEASSACSRRQVGVRPFRVGRRVMVCSAPSEWHQIPGSGRRQTSPR
jgi:Bifunctional DNA primase/polymerase, N-terminal